MDHTVVIQVAGMDCAGCERRLGTVVGRLAGVRQVDADHRTGRVQVTFNPAQTEFAVLVERIEQAGFEVSGAEATDGEGQS